MTTVVMTTVANDDGERVGAADWWSSTVPDDDWNVIFFALFPVERLQTRDHSRPVAVVTAAYMNRYTLSRKTCLLTRYRTDTNSSNPPQIGLTITGTHCRLSFVISLSSGVNPGEFLGSGPYQLFALPGSAYWWTQAQFSQNISVL